jgi:hypothetical protein
MNFLLSELMSRCLLEYPLTLRLHEHRVALFVSEELPQEFLVSAQVRIQRDQTCEVLRQLAYLFLLE